MTEALGAEQDRGRGARASRPMEGLLTHQFPLQLESKLMGRKTFKSGFETILTAICELTNSGVSCSVIYDCL